MADSDVDPQTNSNSDNVFADSGPPWIPPSSPTANVMDIPTPRELADMQRDAEDLTERFFKFVNSTIIGDDFEQVLSNLADEAIGANAVFALATEVANSSPPISNDHAIDRFRELRVEVANSLLDTVNANVIDQAVLDTAQSVITSVRDTPTFLPIDDLDSNPSSFGLARPFGDFDAPTQAQPVVPDGFTPMQPRPAQPMSAQPIPASGRARVATPAGSGNLPPSPPQPPIFRAPSVGQRGGPADNGPIGPGGPGGPGGPMASGGPGNGGYTPTRVNPREYEFPKNDRIWPERRYDSYQDLVPDVMQAAIDAAGQRGTPVNADDILAAAQEVLPRYVRPRIQYGASLVGNFFDSLRPDAYKDRNRQAWNQADFLIERILDGGDVPPAMFNSKSGRRTVDRVEEIFNVRATEIHRFLGRQREVQGANLLLPGGGVNPEYDRWVMALEAVASIGDGYASKIRNARTQARQAGVQPPITPEQYRQGYATGNWPRPNPAQPQPGQPQPGQPMPAQGGGNGHGSGRTNGSNNFQSLGMEDNNLANAAALAAWAIDDRLNDPDPEAPDISPTERRRLELQRDRLSETAWGLASENLRQKWGADPAFPEAHRRELLEGTRDPHEVPDDDIRAAISDPTEVLFSTEVMMQGRAVGGFRVQVGEGGNAHRAAEMLFGLNTKQLSDLASNQATKDVHAKILEVERLFVLDAAQTALDDHIVVGQTESGQKVAFGGRVDVSSKTVQLLGEAFGELPDPHPGGATGALIERRVGAIADLTVNLTAAEQRQFRSDLGLVRAPDLSTSMAPPGP